MTEDPAEPAEGPAEPALVPPACFVDRFNARALANGWAMRSALDPLLMMMWHLASEPPPAFPLVLPPL